MTIANADEVRAALELPMLPAVAAAIEQMRAEQAQQLREQQAAIVELVMRSLNERGVIPAASNSPDGRHGASEQPAATKLEQSLHSLVARSLDESGLNYPHVLRTALSSEQAPRPTRLSPTKSSRTRSGKATVVSRHEPSATEDDPTCDERMVGDCAVDTSTHEKATQPAACTRKKKAAPTLITKSPLQVTTPCRESRRNKPTRHRRERRGSAGRNDPDAGDEFDSVRNKVGSKTLAILDRSRALLDEMKKQQRSSHGGGSSSAFVTRLRQTLVAPRDQETGTGAEDAEVDCDGDRLTERDSRFLSSTSDKTNEKGDADCEGFQNSQPRTLSETATARTPYSPTKAMNDPSVASNDIEILKPPAHSPENENEWENELARQILTIYATSVKATNRPSSHASSGAVTLGLDNKNPRLGASCSLPTIGHARQTASVTKSRRDSAPSRSPPRSAVQYSWEPSQRLQDGRVVVNMPKVPKPIWFAGTGAVKAVWCAIAEGFQGLHASPRKAKVHSDVKDAAAVCEHQLCEEVRRLEAKQQYSQCITTLETLLVSLVRARGVDTLDTKLWKQLVVTCNAFASRCIDYKKFAVALQLIKQAEHLLHNSILVADAMRFELLAYLYDTYAHYYYRRAKSHAGLQYMFKAHEIHVRQSSWAHLAKCRLHIANLLSQQGKHQDAMGYMGSILHMIEERKLEDPPDQSSSDGAGASAQKVCLAAVCYNNLAIEQLHLRAFEAASVSAGNAKRLARLCLSYSNRWLAQFDATSNCVDLAIATLMEDENATANAAYKG